jgi:DNA repair and recombination protein RAD52
MPALVYVNPRTPSQKTNMTTSVGDQHKPNGTTTANPFEDNKQQTTQYSAAEIATLQARLDKQLGPEFIYFRPGPGGQKVPYLAAEKVINLANEVFGFNGWSSSIQNIQIDFVDENTQTGRVSIGLSVVVRVTLRDGTYHEDVGYGNIENSKGKAAAFSKAKKEGTTDALKRTLRTFGNVLGNCLYDQEFVKRVTKMKVGKGKWDENELHRHPDFAPVKKEEYGGSGESRTTTTASVNVSSTTEQGVDLNEGFDINDFDDAEFGDEGLGDEGLDDEEFGDPDQIVLAEPAASRESRATNGALQQMGPPVRNGMTTPSGPPIAKTSNVPPAPTRGPLFSPQTNNQSQQRVPGAPSANQAIPMGRPLPNQEQFHDPYNANGNHHSPSPGVPSQHFAPQGINLPNQHQHQNGPPPAAFYSARAARNIDADNNLVSGVQNTVPKFNPHAESPSIRKTVGVDHRKSAPLRKDIVVKDIVMGSGPSGSKDFIDPKTDPARRLGIPGQGAMSPVGKNAPGGMGTSAYRPPSRRAMDPAGNTAGADGQWLPGGVERVMTAAKRAPLGDPSNVQHHQHSATTFTSDGGDAKRMKITGPVYTTNGLQLPGQGQRVEAGAENAIAGG